MADIDIQKKRGPGVWPWIAGLVVLALIVWGVMEMTGDRTAARDTGAQPAAEQQAPTVGPAPDMTTQPGTPGTDPAAPGTTAPGTTAPGTGTGTGTTAPGTTPQTDPATGQPMTEPHDVPAGQQRNW